MNTHIWQTATNMAQAAFATVQSNVKTEAAPKPGCDLSDAIKKFLANIITQVKNAIPQFVGIALLVIGVATLALAFTGRLGRVGGMFGGVILGVAAVDLAGPLAHILAPSSCG